MTDFRTPASPASIFPQGTLHTPALSVPGHLPRDWRGSWGGGICTASGLSVEFSGSEQRNGKKTRDFSHDRRCPRRDSKEAPLDRCCYSQFTRFHYLFQKREYNLEYGLNSGLAEELLLRRIRDILQNDLVHFQRACACQLHWSQILIAEASPRLSTAWLWVAFGCIPGLSVVQNISTWKWSY
jgi:hypothetical protein